MTLSIRIAQLNFVVGDMAGNANKIIDAARQAHADGVQLLLTPELSICGYAAEDLFLRPSFMAACDDAVKQVALGTAGLTGLAVVVGHPASVGGGAAPAQCVRASVPQCRQRTGGRTGCSHLRQTGTAQLPSV